METKEYPITIRIDEVSDLIDRNQPNFIFNYSFPEVHNGTVSYAGRDWQTSENPERGIKNLFSKLEGEFKFRSNNANELYTSLFLKKETLEEYKSSLETALNKFAKKHDLKRNQTHYSFE